MRKFNLLILLIVWSSLSYAVSSTHNLLGTWTMLDERTGKPYAEVELMDVNGVLRAKVSKILVAEPPKICANCSGQFKNKPLHGMVFLWDLKPTKHDKWGNGKMLDLHTGKIYNAQLKHIKDKLYVRFYVGVSLLGKTQVWQR